MTKAEQAKAEAVAKAMQKICMASLEKKDRALKLTGNGKKCYDYLTDQFTFNYVYVTDKSLASILDDLESDRFYNTWLAFLDIVKYIIRDGGKHRGIENIINNSGISRKNLMKFIDYYFQAR